MDIDYKSLFETDETPKLLVKQDGEEWICISANNKFQELFKKIDFFSTPSLKTILPEIDLESIETHYSFDASYNIEVQSLSSQAYLIRFKKKSSKINKDEIEILSSIFESNDIGILVTNEDGLIVRMNKGMTRLFGWKSTQLLNQPFHICIAEDDRERTIHNHQKFIQRGVRSSGEIKILNANNSISDTLCTLTTLTLENGQKYQITTIIDITFRKRMEKSLREAKEQAESSNRAKSSFLANMSHELRTPLNAIIGFSEMLMNQLFGPLGDPKYNEYTHDIHNSACHLLEIINEILDMSRIEAGRVKLAQNEVMLSDVVQTIKRMLSPHMKEKSITFSEEYPEIMPILKVDGRLLRQALINIISNAVKYSDPKSEVQISATFARNEDLVLSVTDNGRGIPKEQLHDVLKPFGRVEDAFRKKADIEGTGLGLPIAKGMIELHGGTLKIASEFGVGTKVDIIIPSYRIIQSKKSAALANFKFETSPPLTKR